MTSATAKTPAATDADAKKATGKTMTQWFSFLDANDALKAGRREATKLLMGQGVKDDWWLITIAVEYEKARGAIEKDGKPKGYGICATKTIGAPVEKVYRAWTEAEALKEWFGPKSTIELTVGERFCNAKGDGGEFKRIRENKDLRFTWENSTCATGSLVDVAFAGKSKDKTGITLNHTRIESRRDADALRAFWGSALNSLKEMFEA